VFEFAVHPSLREIPEAEWDALLGDGPPYLSWAFLHALEETGCVAPDKGWAPAHLSLREAGKLVLVAPAYVKGNSEGEFVFDHSWAQFAYERLQHAYYPKLILACPFTPATGPRLLVQSAAELERLTPPLVAGVRKLLGENELSSAHVLFAEKDQADRLQQAGMLLRYGIQYHWRNAGYAGFDDFLGRYSSKRRNQIRRERREVHDQGLELLALSGSELSPAQIDDMYGFYCATVDKHVWGRHYLNREFFHEVCRRLGPRVLVVLARERSSGKNVGGAFNLVGPHKLYGRYWGASEERRYLHFNVCYYRGIEECIRLGLQGFEPGAGGEHKLARGFEPVITYSAHYLQHPALRAAVKDFVQRERAAVEHELQQEPTILRPTP
jgi:uncharacterized protein